ncbi:MAG: DUF4350 domain-containing protein [Ruminiclostridium sp.]|nr:DUF4350 domain-containing protein [Ruminiclostridium sp.]
MKKRIRKWINFILITLLMTAAVFILYSVTVYQKEYPDYSTYNTTQNGIKALYLLAREMGFSVRRNHYPAQFVEDAPVMVIYRPDDLIFNETNEQEFLSAWLSQGNTMILVPDPQTLQELWIFQDISEQKKQHEIIKAGNITATWYMLEKGRVCVMDSADAFLNAQLKNSDAAVAFVQALEKAGSTKVVFNEYYQFLQKPAPGFWELIGPTGQLITIQLLLCLVLIAIRGWKPFGRVRNEREMVKRPENEVQKALSGLYMRMKAYPLTLSNYYGYFTQKYSRVLATPGPLADKANRILSLCTIYIEQDQKSRKELLTLVRQLERLEAEMIGSLGLEGGKGRWKKRKP